MTLSATQEELLKSAQFHPVFGPDGKIEGIRQLSVATDRRLGMRAVEELVETYEKGDEVIHAAGWSGRQLRILRSAAPDSAHYLKPSKKYDAATGEMVPAMTIILPYEVTWRLFELLFEGQYSVVVKSVTTKDDEEVEPISEPAGVDKMSPEEKKHRSPDNAPGRIFYSRAEVSILLHIGDGQPKEYSGVGVAYDYVRQNKMGNVFAINSARRTVEKGAVSDAKREAISNIGRVFRRAFEDGDEMIQKFEELLVAKLQEVNKVEKPARASDATPVAAPAPRKAGVAGKKGAPKKASKAAAEQKNSAPEVTKAPDQADDEIPYADFEPQEATGSHEAFTVYQQGETLDRTDDADIYFDRIGDLLTESPDVEAAKRTIDENAEDLKRAEEKSEAGNTLAALKEMVLESLSEDNEPASGGAKGKLAPKQEADKAKPSKASVKTGDWKIEVEKPTGAAILDGYKRMFAKAGSPAQVDVILEANTDLAKRLTKAQKASLLNETLKAKKKAG
jgi:hypothetical protein